jgi:osmotically-inducible protein OsmY
MAPRWFLLTLCAALCAGCNRHDTESLSRIGRKIAVHAKNSTGDLGATIDLSWAGRREPSLQEKIQDRLRFENTLTEVAFEVIVHGKEVELKGTAKTPEQRLRAVELAETLAGVEKVINSIKTPDEDESVR